jgi:hypothetical protein
MLAREPDHAMRTGRHAELVRTLAVLATGLVVVSIYAFPGFMAWDSVEQLAQARAGQLTDWHPPLMSAIWGVLDRIVPGAAAMFVLQNSLFLVGLHALLRRRLTPWRAAIATLVIFVWPPSLTMMAVMVKDSLMCGALLAGLAGLTSERRGLRIAGLVAIALAAGLRYNAIAIVVPLLAWLSPWPASRGPWLRAVTGAALAILLTAAAWLANRALTDVPTHPFHYSVAPMDVVGTLTFAPDLPDAEVHALLPDVRFARDHDLQAHARSLYDPNRWWGELIYGPDRLFDEPATPELRAGVLAGWWHLVRAYPGSYLSWRLDLMRELVGLTDVTWTAVYAARHEAGMLKGTSQPPHPRNWLQRWLSARLVALGKSSLMFRPYVYLVLVFVLLIVLRRDRLAVALLTSTLANFLLLFIAAPAPDFRYVHWLIVAVMIGLALRLLASPVNRGDLGRG